MFKILKFRIYLFFFLFIGSIIFAFPSYVDATHAPNGCHSTDAPPAQPGQVGTCCGTEYQIKSRSCTASLPTCGWTIDTVYCNTTTNCWTVLTEKLQGNTNLVPAQCARDCGAPPAITNPDLQGIFGTISHPSQLGGLFFGLTGEQGIGKLLSKVIELLYIFGALVFVVYMIYSGVEFIYSEGSKEQVAEARNRIIYAIIGIIVLALAFVLLRILSVITNFQFFS